MSEKTKGELLKEQLAYEPKNSYERMSEEEIQAAFDFCEDYKRFLNCAKTERESVTESIKLLAKAGFAPFDPSHKYQAGDKVYYNNRDRALIAAVIGTHPLSMGTHIVASHVDAPRIDLKPRPLYEESQMAMFKTHYYGGIKKYQWTGMPLALHGVVIKADGSAISVAIGEDPSDPVFTITDLLPHLAKDQMDRKLREGIRGEELNVLVGGRMFKDDKASERVKLSILSILHEKYGMIEADFLSAELMMVPAFKAQDVGLDRSFIGSYAHDDRVCAYTSLIAAIDNPHPAYTTVTILADKEEVGSDGNSGLSSDMLRFFIEDLAAPHGIPGRTVLMNSRCLSADVNAAFDPTFADVSERKNTCYVNYGTVITKYTGSGGKGGTNDANAEFTGYVRCFLDAAGVIWQTGELGKVDQGGGGTVAKFVANLGVDVIDIGVPVLSMHAPFEVVAKNDVYMTYKAFDAFYKVK